MHFYAHESCGQCTPCREGTGWLTDVLTQVCTGKGRVEDVDLLVDISNNMMGNTICALADGTAMPMLAFVRKFRDEFVAACKSGGIGEKRLDDSVRKLFAGRAA
jgi:NADH-quinone oxidoreductase subunit F